MLRFLINSYSALVEIGLWLMFISYAVAGYFIGGFGGLLFGLIIAFLFGVFFVAPFAALDDIRKSTLRLEKMAKDSILRSVSTVSEGGGLISPNAVNTKASSSMAADHKRANGVVEPGDRIKIFNGREIIKEADGVSVDGVKYSGVLAAERAINDEASKG
ncbi:hypothetical protein EEB11_02620 [Pseudotabrizicola sediminis]|uniref:NfeD-like C-terminal domain-containing protein n=1 Tax=Pseudotabrizicola sediminis TaxID=2486418 RepID=A0ABY2KRN1_9RHOB|nr:hypothetical protein [Pseudotabrizicola sediminis]TGD45444.1 hypothetical protein EEB11_02620 [Pseudotabrizicola sediminis]